MHISSYSETRFRRSPKRVTLLPPPCPICKYRPRGIRACADSIRSEKLREENLAKNKALLAELELENAVDTLGVPKPAPKAKPVQSRKPKRKAEEEAPTTRRQSTRLRRVLADPNETPAQKRQREVRRHIALSDIASWSGRCRWKPKRLDGKKKRLVLRRRRRRAPQRSAGLRSRLFVGTNETPSVQGTSSWT